MKKVMMAMTIVVAISFFSSVIAVAPSAAKAVSKDASNAKSKTPTQFPPHTQGESTVPKQQFWDLVVDHCYINGILVPMNPCSNTTITVKVGQAVVGTCYYKAITLPVADITKADAAYWGSGNLTYVIVSVFSSLKPAITPKKEETKNLPKFTYAFAKNYTKGERMAWNHYMTFRWVATQELIGQNVFLFKLDHKDTIKETGPETNYCFSTAINVTP
jgi:patatin-like phospholipase/acyl hydrolase